MGNPFSTGAKIPVRAWIGRQELTSWKEVEPLCLTVDTWEPHLRTYGIVHCVADGVPDIYERGWVCDWMVGEEWKRAFLPKVVYDAWKEGQADG